MRIVAALGGNALLRRGEPPEEATQRRHVTEAVRALAELAETHELVVTHGNGPQVGLLALQAAAYRGVPPYPLDVLGAESEGMIGYLLEQALRNELPGRPVATLLTQIVVDPEDQAFARPSKPIGPVYAEADARRLAAERGWTIAPDGDSFRRVVASPEPLQVVELEAIRLLVAAGVLVICAGGGGIPVVVDDDGALYGVEAVIDKDLSAALLALLLEADALLMLTDVPAVERDRGTPEAAPIGQATPAELRTLAFASGSMAPKVEAACRFVEAGGRVAAIGALEDAAAIVRGEAGTVVAVESPAWKSVLSAPPGSASRG
ncbi:MAG TPA: carbamate kinase [Gaiellaceae bacterium]|nr:carbamate kinase [Gaiellaceae bacterium]